MSTTQATPVQPANAAQLAADRAVDIVETDAAFASLYGSDGDPHVLVADGHGVKITVKDRQLCVADGVGQHRRTRTIPRVPRTVRRIIVRAASGHITLDAARWCADAGIHLVQLDAAGQVILSAGQAPATDVRLRRSQAFAAEDGPNPEVGLGIVKTLLGHKMTGQAEIAAQVFGAVPATRQIRGQIKAMHAASTVELARGAEGQAADVYWQIWKGLVAAPFTARDAARVPDRWGAFPGRASLLSGRGNRRATDPINALLNYAYRIAEIQCRIACIAVGLDPEMGFLHFDAAGRDSLCLDMLEVLRPHVDRYVLDLIGYGQPDAEPFPRTWFTETTDGECRLKAPLTHRIAEQALTWARVIAPIAEEIAGRLSEACKGESKPRVGTLLTRDKVVMKRPKRVGSASGRNQRVREYRFPIPNPTPERIINDALWDELRAVLPASKRRGPQGCDRRAVIAGIVSVLYLDTPKTKIPAGLGVSAPVVAKWTKKWDADGTLAPLRAIIETGGHLESLGVLTPAA